MNAHLQSNLRLIVNSYGSISEFCRSVGINRQQFNKYLNGRSLPSPRNLRKICGHAGISEGDLFLPAAEFTALHRKPRGSAQEDDLFSFVAHAQANSKGLLKEYGGFYFKYYYSLSKPGLIRKSLVSIFMSGGAVRTKCIEPAGRELTESGMASLCKYYGEVVFLGDRLFTIEYETLLQKEITYSVYFPSYMTPVRILPGLTLGVSAGSRRQPAASRVVLVSVDTQLSVKSALDDCGLFEPTDPSISDHIKTLIDNSTTRGEILFFARTVDDI